MSWWHRLLALVGVKAGRTLDRLEDPAEMLDASYERQIELLRQLRRGIVEVATAKKQIETMKAQYRASTARVEVNEALSGISSEMSDLGGSLERARERVAQLSARAAATDELLDGGTLADLTSGADADLERELGQPAITARVETELASLKAQLDSGRAEAPLGAPREGADGAK